LRWWFSQNRKEIWPAAEAPAEAGPDFICIGMAKAATGWLFDQLRDHPDFWMPSIKELRYLFFDRPRLDDVCERHAQYAEPARRQTANPADVAFIDEAFALAGQPIDVERYAALFRFKGERFSGDITPGYCWLQPRRIRHVAARFPNTKIVLLVRDPVSRLWSHLCMLKRVGQFDSSNLADPVRFHQWFGTSAVRTQSFATESLRRWLQNAPNLRLRYFLFDDVIDDPSGARRDILTFLGANPRRKGGRVPVHYNRKAGKEKMELTESIEQMLIAEMADELRACAETFGGAAKAWPARYGV
jgi:hypothetical protein